MSHISKDVEPQSAEMERQHQRPRRPAQIQIGDCVVAVRHGELGDARVYVGYSIRVEVIQAGQRVLPLPTRPGRRSSASPPPRRALAPAVGADRAGRHPLATARLQPSIPMSVVMLRRDAAASWRVIVRKPYDGWD
jgi:hypothetical protein